MKKHEKMMKLMKILSIENYDHVRQNNEKNRWFYSVINNCILKTKKDII
jgi:hypothetical protein